jgi:hypothetical protein
VLMRPRRVCAPERESACPGRSQRLAGREYPAPQDVVRRDRLARNRRQNEAVRLEPTDPLPPR